MTLKDFNPNAKLPPLTNELDYPSPKLFSFGTAPFLVAGIMDGVNPFALSILLIFVSILIYGNQSRSFLYFFSLSFIAAVYQTWLFYLLGNFDALLTIGIVASIQVYAYILIAVVFLILGVFNFFDWMGFWQEKGVQKFYVPLPPAIQRNSGHKDIEPKRFTLLQIVCKVSLVILLGYFSGVLLTFWGTFWAPHENILLILYQFSLPGHASKAFGVVLLYCLAFVFPLILAAIVFLIPGLNRQLIEACARRISLFKIISSAVFFSSALGIIYFLISN